jgi:copper homeostasis protein
MVFELCVDSVESARIAEKAGANRIELCAQLLQSGVTPRLDLLVETIKAISIPVHVLIRPRLGDFNFSSDEFNLMKRQIEDTKKAGAAGVAIGVSLPDRRIDVARSRELVQLAKPMKATFHRAFDETPNVKESLKDVFATGADCLLTSGGKSDVLTGSDTIAWLREQAGEQCDVMAGGGVRLENLAEILNRTGVSFLHGSFVRRDGRKVSSAEHNGHSAEESLVQLHSDVREAVRLFHREVADRKLPVATGD